jgi:glycine/D-amino acid oxidase-like deaminating enzyme
VADNSYGSPIYWLETAPDQPAPRLSGEIHADVVIAGGGFTGLWTAYQLHKSAPGMRVVILEAQQIAYGASGRNGGFAMTLLDMSLSHLAKHVGAEGAIAAYSAVARSVDEIADDSEALGIDCDYHRGGLMVVGTSDGQLARIERDLETAANLGLYGFTPLSGAAARARLHSPTYRGGYYEACSATIHPAKLARGLKRTLIRRGVTIFEQTPLLGWERSGSTLLLKTPGGAVRADKLVVATNAWSGLLAGFERKVIPLYSYILLTEPLTLEEWQSIGWEGREGVEDKRNYVHYYRPTADGRILWGGSDGILRSDLGITPEQDSHPPTFERLEASFRRTFPQLGGVRFSHRWGGPVAITVPFLPYFGSLRGGQIVYGFGYNGHGVAPAHTGGRILRDLILDRQTSDTALPFVGSRERRFPPRLVTWAGAELTRRLLLGQDERMDRGEAAGEMDPLLLRILARSP